MNFICPRCGRSYPSDDLRWRCDCGGFLMTDHVARITREDIKAERFNMWRYDAAYPISYEDLSVTFDEGLTPLVKIPAPGCRLRAKMDSLMPTGSFKDRGTVMVVNFLLHHGAAKITEDSSGNAGASVAGYCALGKIACDIYIPKGTSYGKTVQIRSYGAAVHEIEGTREDVAAAKPSPEGVLMALERLHARREEVLYVGDSVVDAETARAAGVSFGGVTHGVTTAEELSVYPHRLVMASLEELLL